MIELLVLFEVEVKNKEVYSFSHGKKNEKQFVYLVRDKSIEYKKKCGRLSVDRFFFSNAKLFKPSYIFQVHTFEAITSI